jgi:hypothetical protein
MSGSKQHFIPQSLLKGFGRAGAGKKVQVVVYTYDRGTFPAATDGVAAEREFYSKLAVEGQGDTLDDKITEYETPLADTLLNLRSLADGEGADTRTASEFVTHLVVRNDHLRKFVSSAGTALFEGFADAMSDQARAKALLGLSGEKPSAMVTERLEKAFAEFAPLMAIAGLSEEQFKELGFAHIQANFGAFHAELMGPLQAAFANVSEQVAETAADAHRRSLGEALSPEPRVERMMEYEWRTVHTATPVVLPDCVAVAFDATGEAFPLMLADLDEAQTILVPLSADRLLVGTRESAELPDDLNDVFASCSWDFFVAAERTNALEGLRDKIRSRPGKQVDDTIAGALSDALTKHSKHQP